MYSPFSPLSLWIMSFFFLYKPQKRQKGLFTLLTPAPSSSFMCCLLLSWLPMTSVLSLSLPAHPEWSKPAKFQCLPRDRSFSSFLGVSVLCWGRHRPREGGQGPCCPCLCPAAKEHPVHEPRSVVAPKHPQTWSCSWFWPEIPEDHSCFYCVSLELTVGKPLKSEELKIVVL